MSAEDPVGRGGWDARRVARLLLVLLVVGLPVLLGSVALDLLDVRRSLQEARGAIAEARGSLGNVDVAAAQEALTAASDELAEAQRQAQRPTWSFAAGMPYLGPTVVVTRDVVEVAAAAVDVAQVAVEDGAQLLSDGLELAVDGDRIDLAPVLEARALTADLPTERLQAARDRLAEPPPGWLPDPVAEGRRDTLELADETLGTLHRAEALASALPPFLGADGPRRYFVGFQTSAELRGTGGLISYWAVLGADDGRITLGPSEAFEAADADGDELVGRIGSISFSPVNPPDADPAFLARYATVAAARSFPNVNLDPDLPTTGKAILDLFELQTGERLDGVILLDPPGVQRLLATTGPTLPLDPQVAASLGLDGGELPIDDFTWLTTDGIYDRLGADRTDERREVFRSIGDAAFARIVLGGWEGADMARAVVEASAERHLQLYTTDAQVQDAFVDVGVAGSLAPDVGADLLAVTANNVVGGKQDVHLGHAVDVEVQLRAIEVDDDGGLHVDRDLDVEVTVTNELPTEGRDIYVIGSCFVPGAPNRCFEGNPGENRTWFSTWTDPATRVVRVDSSDGTSPSRLNSRFRDLRVTDHFLVTPPGSSASYRLETAGRAPLRSDDEAVVYELLWWRQAKAIPDLLDVVVVPPPGWAIGDVEVVGGGSGVGSGPNGAGVPLDIEVAADRAQVRGTVTADTRLLVSLVDPGDGGG